jgi:predicted nucleic-acid-binding protein
MLGIDTNVLVRYLVQDDTIQAEKASRVIENECTSINPGFINNIVLCELVWVLTRAYGYKRKDICSVLKSLLTCPEIMIENSNVTWGAFYDYEKGPADFADYLISRTNKINGADPTVTFDTACKGMSHFRLIK